MSERAWQRPSSCVLGLHSTRLLANSSAGQDGNGPNRGRVEAVVSIGYPVGGRSIRSPAPSCAGRIRSATPTMPSPSRLTPAGWRCEGLHLGSAPRFDLLIRSHHCTDNCLGLLPIP